MAPDAVPIPIEELLRHRAWVQRLARSLVRDPASAEDLEQEAWVTALERPPSRTEGMAGTRAWLGRVLRNRAIDRGRARARREAHESAGARTRAEPSAADAVARAETHRRVVDAVMELEEPLRTAVVLRFFDGLPPREVARQTGVPTETARTRIGRGVSRLRERLGVEEEGRDRRALWAFAFGPPGLGAGASGGGLGFATTKGAIVALTAKQIVAIGAAVVAVIAVGVVVPLRASAVTRSSTATVAPTLGEAELAARGRPPARVSAGAAAGPATSAPGRGPVRLQVRREDGASVGGTSVFLETEGAVAAALPVGDDGGLDIDAADQERAAFVVAPGAAIRRFAIPAATAQVELVVPSSAVVSGTVLVDGEMPSRPLVLGLRASEPSVALESLPRPPPFDPWSLGVTTDVRGAFRAIALPDGAIVHFSGPVGFVVASPAAVRAPDGSVVVRLRRLPRLRGRVVRAGVPLAGAGVCVPWSDGSSSGQVSATTDDAGRFGLVLEAGSPHGTTLLVTDAQGLARAERALPTARDLDTDVGDVELPDPWAAVMRLEVVGTDGRPVAGAVAMLPGDPSWTSAPAGADGILRLPARSEAGPALVAGLGHRIREVALVATGDLAARVVLDPTATLRIRATGVDGPVVGGSVSVRGAGRVFDEPESHAALELREAIGGTHASSSVLAQEGDFAAFPLESGGGDLVVPWVLPGRPVHLELADTFGEILAVAEVHVEHGEARTVVLAAKSPARRVEGIVRDPRGLPIPRAQVVARAGTRRDPDALGGLPGPIVVVYAEADGRFHLEGVHGAALDLFVTAPHLAPWARRAVRLPEAGRALEIPLAAGRTLTVRPRGAPTAGLDVWAESPDPEVWTPGYRPWSGMLQEDGTVRIEGVPDGAAEVVVRTAAGEARTPVPAGVTDVEAVLPKEK